MDVLHLDAVHLLFLLPESPESQVMNGSISCRSVDRSSDGMGFLSIPLSSGKYVRGSWDCSFLPGRVTHGGEAARVYKTDSSHKSVCPDPRTTMHLINR